MNIAYLAIGNTSNGQLIRGNVLIDSALQQQSPGDHPFSYAINAYHFVSDGLIYSGMSQAGIPVGGFSFSQGPTPGTVLASNAGWTIGYWHGGPGVIFRAADGTPFGWPAPAEKHDYLHLPSRIELCCDYMTHQSLGPFRPAGWLKLLWMPEFPLAAALKPDIFAAPDQ